MKRYLRALIEHFPHAAVESYRVLGWRGLYLSICAFVLRDQPFAVTLPGFGKVGTWGEAMNLVDNFALGELRCEAVENHLRTLPDAWIVDVGVNIGVTCRWWLSLTPTIRVVGIDMFQEALDFTSAKIASMGQQSRWHPLCGAIGDRNATTELRFNNPLEGTSRLDASTGSKSRMVRVETLDAMLAPLRLKRIGLLKLDIEGAAGMALRGASGALSRCDYVSVETHSDEETQTASSALTAAGFQVFRCWGRTMWWRR